MRFEASELTEYDSVFLGNQPCQTGANFQYFGNCVCLPMLCESLSPWLGASLGCRWRRETPDMESSCKYME